jgi:hypothetical protein
MAGKKARRLLSGGNFETIARVYQEGNDLPFGNIVLRGSNGPETHFECPTQRAAVAAITNDAFPVPHRSSTSELKALGREAIARTVPTASEVDLSTTLAELISEGLPSMIGLSSRRGDPSLRRGASENLNYEFGVKPLINDVQDAVDAFRRSKQIWDQYVRNAGRVLRRRYDFLPEMTVTTSEDTGNPVPYGNRFLYQGTSHPRKTVTTTKKWQWFVGHYRYAVPPDPFARNLSRWNKLYGVTPDIETLWNLAPWSWAADWVSDIGTSVSNFAAFQADGLVLLSGYMMEQTSVKKEIYLGPVRYVTQQPGVSGPTRFFTQTFYAERKRRIIASPYGFDLDWDGFSARQVGILASLGITRGRRK